MEASPWRGASSVSSQPTTFSVSLSTLDANMAACSKLPSGFPLELALFIELSQAYQSYHNYEEANVSKVSILETGNPAFPGWWSCLSMKVQKKSLLQTSFLLPEDPWLMAARPPVFMAVLPLCPSCTLAYTDTKNIGLGPTPLISFLIL